MPTRNVGHHDRPSPDVSELVYGNHHPDCLPERLSEAPDPLEARAVSRALPPARFRPALLRVITRDLFPQS